MKLILSLLMLLTFLNASEEVPTQEEVAKLYVATFNRAPDAAGLNYWTNDSGLTLSGIAQSFFDQEETTTLYPAGTSNTDFITSVYANLFNRTPDTDGLNYWEGELDRGAFSKNSFIQAVINGAQNTDTSNDADILSNKTTVGLSFSEAGKTDVNEAKSIMVSVNADSSSVDSAVTQFGISKYVKSTTDSSTPSLASITHNGVSYGTLTSSTTGKIWLDRNLGASQVCQSTDYEECYGDYYQWGRDVDGHEKIASEALEAVSTSVNVNHGKYISISGDWTDADIDGSYRRLNWNPCPNGYRVPTIDELLLESPSELNFPFSGGYRYYTNRIIVENESRVWSSTPDTEYSTTAHELRVNSHSSAIAMRTSAQPVRCIQDLGLTVTIENEAPIANAGVDQEEDKYKVLEDIYNKTFSLTYSTHLAFPTTISFKIDTKNAPTIYSAKSSSSGAIVVMGDDSTNAILFSTIDGEVKNWEFLISISDDKALFGDLYMVVNVDGNGKVEGIVKHKSSRYDAIYIYTDYDGKVTGTIQ